MRADESVRIATTATLANPWSMKADVFLAILVELFTFRTDLPVDLSKTTWIAPTVIVVAKKAHTTPIASVVPNALRGSIGDISDRNAVTVVTTDNVSANLNPSKDSTWAREGPCLVIGSSVSFLHVYAIIYP